MTFDQSIKLIELGLTVLGLIAVVFGWIIPFRQSQIIEKERKSSELDYAKLQWEKEQIDTQIAKFYGPISALLNEQDILFSLILHQIGRTKIFPLDHDTINDLPESEARIWIHYVNTYKIP